MTPTNTSTATPSLTPSATNTYTPTVTDTPTITLTPTITDTPTITPSPTFDYPDVEVLMNAHCRYGPGVGYLHAIDLWIGDKGIVWNRNYSGTWLWVKFDKHHTACWVAASVLEVQGDVFTVVEYYHPLPKSTLYNAPEWVRAERSGDQVTVTWKSVWMTEDDYRGYMIEARLCQNGHLYDTAVAIDGTSYTFTDEQNCDRDSGGRLYTLEKHGYSEWINIPWTK